MGNNPNTGFDAFNPEVWAPKMQETFLKESVAIGLANTELRAVLSEGDAVNSVYGSYPRVQTYVPGTDIDPKDLTATNEQLSVDTVKVASFYVDKINKTQSKYGIIEEFAPIAQRQLNNVIDQSVMSNYSSAGTTLDAAAVGGTAGSGIVLATGNVADIFVASDRVLNTRNRMNRDRFSLIGPRILEKLKLYVGNRETGFGDTVSDNGRISNRFGFGLTLSNNLPFSATFDMDTILADTDTIVVNGVTFTADANGAASGAGHFSIGENAAACKANIVLAINGTGTPGAGTYVEISAEDRQLIEEAGMVAVASGTDVNITGYGDIVVSTSNSVSAAWSAQYQYALMGVRGAIDLLTQTAPEVEFRNAQLRLGKYVHPYTLFGTKLFARKKDSLVAVKFDVSTWV